MDVKLNTQIPLKLNCEKRSYNQVFSYLGLIFTIYPEFDTIHIFGDDLNIMINLSAFLLKIDPTFTLNQFISIMEEAAIKCLKKLSTSIVNKKIVCEFLPNGTKLKVILRTNFKTYHNYEYLFDVSNHFFIVCNSDDDLSLFYAFNILKGRTVRMESIPHSDSFNHYMSYITSLVKIV